MIIIHGLLPLALSLARSHSADSVPYSDSSLALSAATAGPFSFAFATAPRVHIPTMAKTAMGKNRASLSPGSIWSPSLWGSEDINRNFIKEKTFMIHESWEGRRQLWEEIRGQEGGL